MRDRLLIRHFLWRFLEHDLISPTTDRRDVLSASAGFVLSVSLFAAVLVAWPYQLEPTLPPGITSLRFFDDRFLFIASSMLVLALAAVAQWDALVLDARDTAILGPLPLPKSVIVRTKFASTLVFAMVVLVLWNGCPTVLRLAAIPLGLPVGVPGALQLTLAHFVATFAAGAFGFLTVLALRETSFALLGANGFRRVSALMQGLLLVAAFSGLILLPGQSSRVAERWLAAAPATAKMFPPLWFVGLHEAMAGAVVDNLPRVEPETWRQQRELQATDTYRSVRPLFRELSMTALLALLAAAAIAVAACAWNSRQLPVAAVHIVHREGMVRRALLSLAHRTIVPTALERAGFFFALQTLSRRVSHRVALAAATAVGVSILVIAASGRPDALISSAAAIPVPMLAAQSLVIASVLTGFRHATRVPSDLRASSTFALAWSGQATAYVDGVKRAGWVAVVVPALVVTAAWHSALLDPRLALLHFGVGLAVAGAVMEAIFLRDRRLPFVSAYAPGVDAKAYRVAYCLAVLVASLFVASLERAALDSQVGYPALIAGLTGVTVSLKAFDRLFPVSAVPLDLEERPALPTQRLDLMT